MTPRILAIATASVAALTLAACNRPAEEPTTPMSEDAVDAASTAEPTTGTAPATTGASTSAAGETASGSMSSGGETMSPSGSTSAGSSMSTAPTVNSDIPADAPSRNTRETAGAAGAPNQGQPTSYAYSPTNPAHQAKK